MIRVFSERVKGKKGVGVERLPGREVLIKLRIQIHVEWFWSIGLEVPGELSVSLSRCNQGLLNQSYNQSYLS